MLFKNFSIDERTRSSSRYAAAIWLGVTHILLAGVIFYRLYILGQVDEEIRDFQAVLAISIFGYIGLQLVLGGVMPTLTWKGMFVSYIVLAGTIVLGCLAFYGWPKAEDWANTWLPSLLGPALFVGVYSIIARIGQWNVERQLGLDE